MNPTANLRVTDHQQTCVLCGKRVDFHGGDWATTGPSSRPLIFCLQCGETICGRNHEPMTRRERSA